MDLNTSWEEEEKTCPIYPIEEPAQGASQDEEQPSNGFPSDHFPHQEANGKGDCNSTPSPQHGHHLSFTQDEEQQEKRHFQTVLSAFRYYRTYSLKKIARQQAHFNGLSSHQRQRLPQFMSDLASLRQVIAINDRFVQDLLSHLPFQDTPIADPAEGGKQQRERERVLRPLPVGSFHMDKVQTTLRMFMRDWSKAGEAERSQAYQPLIQAVLKYCPIQDKSESVRILNPGAGLGRLSWELSKLGYASIGNEFSLYMLFASNFVLNHCQEVDMYKIYPWVNQSSNNLSSLDQLSAICIPDVNPAGDLPQGHQFGMVAGDFLEIFERDANWDAIVTSFFVDTARNILDYVEHIWHLLKPGAFWFNLGPLLYHFADMANECCIELSYDQLKAVILNTGFTFLEERHDVTCSYVQNPNSMLRYEYRCTFFVCQKPFPVTPNGESSKVQ